MAPILHDGGYMRSSVIIAVAALMLTGCGALFNSGPATVMFTSAPNEAEVWINGSRLGATPVSLQLAKNQNHTVVFRRDGYLESTYNLNRQISATYVILDILGGVLPVVVDAATGAWYVLPTNSVNVTLARAAGEEEEVLVQRGTLTPAQLADVRRGVPMSRIVPVEALLR
jgi:hypothetical protein